MTREKTIERIISIRKEKANSIISETAEPNESEEILKDLDALDMGLAYLSRDMKEWIKTKERLPVEGDNVLLYVNDGRDKYITFGYIFSYDERVFVFCTFGDEYINESKVPYWMSLPEPPKGE